jgi:hypothetical protein
MKRILVCMLLVLLSVTMRALGATESLWWIAPQPGKITCIYGQVTPLVSIPNIYFCGVQWGGVGGYCGIQHNGVKERRTIFSIWDTSPTLHPRVIEADPQTAHNRFGGEGEGAHTHMLWDWKYEEPFQFFLQKQPGKTAGTTETRYYFFDPIKKSWRHMATISSPDGEHGRGTKFVEICSWIENFAGKNMEKPKMAMYELWVGNKPENLKHVTRSAGASGSGRWGKLHDAFFLAEGSPEQLAPVFAKLKAKYSEPTFGKDGQEMTLPEKPLEKELIGQLRNLPQAESTEKKTSK